MGGKGSGRPPSTETIVKRSSPEITPIGDSTFLPNYSGVKPEALRTSSVDIAAGAGSGDKTLWVSGAGIARLGAGTQTISGAGLIAEGVVSGAFFVGDGSLLTNVSGTGGSDLWVSGAGIARLREGTQTISGAGLIAEGTISGARIVSSGDISGATIYGDGSNLTGISGAGDPKTDKYYDYPAGSFDYPVTSGANLDTKQDPNGNTIKRHLFDDTDTETVIGQFKIPSDVDGAGTVTFETVGFASTASGSTLFTMFEVEHSAINNGEVFSGASFSRLSGASINTDTTQDALDVSSFTETISNLGWAANDHIQFKLNRIVSGANLLGDYGLTHFRIKVPRT